MLLRRRRGSVRPRARRGRLRRWSRAGGRARKASAPILACGAPGGVPSRAPGEGCCPPWPSAKKLSRARRVWQIDRTQLAPPGGLPEIASTRKNLARMMTVAPSRSKTTRTAHRARARGWFPSFTTRATRQRRDTMSQEGGVSARCAATVPAATHAPKPHPTPRLFCYLVRVSRIFARKKTRRRDPRSARARALVADTPILPPAPVPPVVARAPSSRAPRPSAAAPPRPRARANAHRKTDGSSAKTPSQRRGSRAMAPRGGRACPAENAEWNPTRGNL